jgi:uncharacterized protein YigE (DUF2233 family)/acetyl esterase/lipase
MVAILEVKTLLFLYVGVLLLVARSSAVEFTNAVIAGRRVIVCRVNVRKEKLELFLHDDTGQPFKSFDAIERSLRPTSRKLVFGMNAGMYQRNFSPVGLFVSGGKELAPLNTNSGTGNFYLKPNGVFLVSESGARVVESAEYPGIREGALLATQSGPLLVRNGGIHPAFNAGSESRLIRNGVGVPSPDVAVFAITDEPVNLHEFATFFRDVLKCPDALYLDGVISSLHSPERKRSDRKTDLGPIIAVIEMTVPKVDPVDRVRMLGAMRAILATFFLGGIVIQAQVQSPVPLWSGEAPGALGSEEKDRPTLTPYLPQANATGAAVVVCPGGGYGGLAGHEGNDYAQWLNQQGLAAFVLKYRLGSHGYRHPIMLQDAARALRLVRARAEEWKVDPKRVAIMGSSAGGHLASTLVTHFDTGNSSATDVVERQSSRPDLGILCYPVISMGEFTHQGSKNNLLGKEPTEELVKLLSNELQVTSNTPPCFIWHTWEDKAVKVENSLQFASALQRAGVPFDLHVYEKGRHGIGLADKAPYTNAHVWSKDLVFWLKGRGFVN